LVDPKTTRKSETNLRETILRVNAALLLRVGDNRRGSELRHSQPAEIDPKSTVKLPQRFYGSCQGLREPPWIELGFMGVDRPGGASDAPRDDDEGCCAR
jgi:hypothetical protein